MQASEFPETQEPAVKPAGLWRIVGDRLILVDRGYGGPATVLAPSEEVLILTVDLPFNTRRQRQDALPFAVEERIGEPIDHSHVVMGMEISPRRHLCGVVRLDTMRRWVRVLTESGLEQAVLIPDALMQPPPPEGTWRLLLDGDRAVVRSHDGGGFAAPIGVLPTFWEAAGRPNLLSSGDALPEVMRDGINDISFNQDGSSHPAMVTPPLDLRQGAFAASGRKTSSTARTLGAILALGVAAHAVILGVDTSALILQANKAETATRQLLVDRFPGAGDAPDLSIAVAQAAPDMAGDGAAITMLARVSQALTGAPVTFRSISYAPGEPLQLGVSTPDAAGLERAVGVLNGAGLRAESRLDPTLGGGGGLNAAIAVTRVGDQP